MTNNKKTARIAGVWYLILAIGAVISQVIFYQPSVICYIAIPISFSIADLYRSMSCHLSRLDYLSN